MQCKGCAQAWVNRHWKETAAGRCTCYLINPWSPRNYGSHRIRSGIKAALHAWTETLQVGDRVALFSDIREKDDLGNQSYTLSIAKIVRIITEGSVYIDGEPVNAKPLFVLNNGTICDDLGRDVTNLQRAYSHFGENVWSTTQMRQLTQNHLDVVEREYLLKELKRALWTGVSVADLRTAASFMRIAPPTSMHLQPLDTPQPLRPG